MAGQLEHEGQHALAVRRESVDLFAVPLPGGVRAAQQVAGHAAGNQKGVNVLRRDGDAKPGDDLRGSSVLQQMSTTSRHHSVEWEAGRTASFQQQEHQMIVPLAHQKPNQAMTCAAASTRDIMPQQ